MSRNGHRLTNGGLAAFLTIVALAQPAADAIVVDAALSGNTYGISRGTVFFLAGPLALITLPVPLVFQRCHGRLTALLVAASLPLSRPVLRSA